MTNQAQSKKLTLPEAIVVAAIIIILSIITLVVVNPVGRFNIAADNKRQEDVAVILTTIVNYRINHKGNFPKANDTDLPTVTPEDILTLGAEANKLEGFNLATHPFPVDPNGSQYRVGKLASGLPIVGTRLSDGSILVVSR